MKKFLIDSLIFMLLMFAFMGLINSNDTNTTNNKVSSFDQNFNSNQEVEDGYVNGVVGEEDNTNTFAEATNYVSDKLIDMVNGGANFFKKVIKSFLD